ncbi:PREDICTED: uncharacterized protein LOC101312025 [Fragaria vesca subsp. vesca]
MIEFVWKLTSGIVLDLELYICTPISFLSNSRPYIFSSPPSLPSSPPPPPQSPQPTASASVTTTITPENLDASSRQYRHLRLNRKKKQVTWEGNEFMQRTPMFECVIPNFRCGIFFFSCGIAECLSFNYNYKNGTYS